MEKTNTVKINAGTAIILNETLGELAPFTQGTMNTGELIATTQAYQALMEKKFQINAGSTHILQAKGPIRFFEQGSQLLMAEENSISNHYIFVQGDLILPPEGLATLNAIEGLYVSGTLYYAANYPLGNIPNMTAHKSKVYPPQVIVIHKKKWALTKGLYETLEENTLYYVTGALQGTDPSLGQLEKTKGISFMASSILVKEDYLPFLGNLISDKKTIIPLHHAVVTGDLLLSATTFPLYGEKLFITGDLLVQPKSAPYLEDFTSIIVQKQGKLSLEALPSFKKIGTAQRILAFEGELKELNGKTLYSHATLSALLQAGITYTLRINGLLHFEEDVLPEDLDVFNSIICNGMVTAPQGLLGFLQGKIDELNGVLLPNNDPLSQSLLQSEGGSSPFEKDSSITTINTGDLVIA